MGTRDKNRSICYGVFFLSLCILISEFILTRIYSVILGYHFAFLAISIALFGLGLAGILVYVKRDWFPEERMFIQMSRAAMLLGIALYLVVIVLLNLPTRPSSFVTLTIVYFFSVLPFFFGGICLALVFTHRSKIINRIYYFDLIGAATGSLGTILILNLLSGPSALFLVGFLAVFAGLLFGLPHDTKEEESAGYFRKFRRFGIWVAVLSIAGLAVSPFIRSIALDMGRKFYDNTVQWFKLPNSFEWYVENYIGAELDSITVFVKVFFAAGLLLALASVALGHWGMNKPRLPGWLKGHSHLLLPCWVALFMVVFFFNQLVTGVVKVRFAKGKFEAVSLFEKWNSISRIKVFPHKGWSRSRIMAWGLSYQYDGPEIDQVRMNIDSQAGMPIIRFDGDLESPQAQHLKYDVSSIGYYLSSDAYCLVIGPGGGRDILTSLVFGARKVVGVELNPIILEVVNDVFGDYSGHLYKRDDVDLILGEGRSFLKRTKEHYDIIQISLIDTWAAAAKGALAISENTLYTQEAFDDYFEHLTQNGILSITRWWRDPPLLLWRKLWMTINSLSSLGEDPSRNIMVIRGPQRGEGQSRVANLIVKRSALTEEEIDKITNKSAELGFDVIYAPGRESFEEVASFILSSPDERGTFAKALKQDIEPSKDDRPFFFSTTKPGSFFLFGKAPLSMTILSRLLYLVFILVVLFMVTPLIVLKRGDLATIRSGGKKWLLYFGCLGMGFIIIEIVLIQKFILFLGHPIYAITVIVFGMLTSSSFGSLLSGRFGEGALVRRLALVLGGMVVVLYSGLALIPVITNLFFHMPLLVRILVALAIIAPMGFLMGMPFPTGIRILSRDSNLAVPWMWGVNGSASVLGTILAACSSIYFGFTVTFGLGAAFYVFALLNVVTMLRTSRSNADFH